MKPALAFFLRILLRTVLRFNPFYKPVIPALITVYLIAIVFTILYVRDRILCTFIVEYRELTLSAWGFLLLMNFLEAIMENLNHDDEEG